MSNTLLLVVLGLITAAIWYFVGKYVIRRLLFKLKLVKSSLFDDDYLGDLEDLMIFLWPIVFSWLVILSVWRKQFGKKRKKPLILRKRNKR